MRAIFAWAILMTACPTSVFGQLYERFGSWEVTEPMVNFPPGMRSDTLIARQQTDLDDIRLTEYAPKLIVTCSRGTAGPYDGSRIRYASLKLALTWLASRLPKEFEKLNGIVPGEGTIGSNAIWISNIRSPSALIKVAEETAPDTIKVELAPLRESKRYRFSAEILDGNAAQAFLTAWATKDRLPVQILDAEGRDLDKAIDLREMRLPVNKVLTYCGRTPL